MNPVTDPALLAQLNAAEPASPVAPAGLKPVTDPALLQALDAPDVPDTAAPLPRGGVPFDGVRPSLGDAFGKTMATTAMDQTLAGALVKQFKSGAGYNPDILAQTPNPRLQQLGSEGARLFKEANEDIGVTGAPRRRIDMMSPDERALYESAWAAKTAEEQAQLRAMSEATLADYNKERSDFVGEMALPEPEGFGENAAAISGAFAGSMMSPENLAGLEALNGPRAAAPVAKTLLGKIAQKGGQIAATAAEAGAENAAVGVPTNLAVEGMQGRAVDMGQLVENTGMDAALGVLLGGGGRAAGMALEKAGAALASWARARKLASMTDAQAEIKAAAAAGDPEVVSILKGAGVTDAQLAAMSDEFKANAANRVVNKQTDDFSLASLPQDTDRADALSEIDKVLLGEIDPGASNVATQMRAPVPEVLPVTPKGEAVIPDAGTAAGQRLRSGNPRSTALVPLEPQPNRMTPDEIKRAQADMRGGNANKVPDQNTMTVPTDRAPQSSDQKVQDQQAREAFALAEQQRLRAQTKPLDTQPAARPQGTGQQQVYLDDGFPVEIQSRQFETVNGKTFETATVQRVDPRTGQVDPESVPYKTLVSGLKTKQYAPEPRQAQDFVDRAKGPVAPEQPRMADNPAVTREPNQTYRATDADPNTEFPAAGDGRSPLPKQPEGPAPWRDRPRREEEVLRDYEDRQAKGDQGSKSKNDYSGQEWKKSFSNKSAEPDKDGRFGVDDAGFVASDKGGPVKFGDQKQAAKWIINVGHKKSPDQIFEIHNHPSGKGFTVRERGRSEGGPEGGAKTAAPEAPQSEAPKGAAPQLEKPMGRSAAPAAAYDGPDVDPNAPREAAPAPAPKPRPQNLFEFIAARGGVKDEHSARYDSTAAGNAKKAGGELDGLYWHRKDKGRGAGRQSVAVKINGEYKSLVNNKRGLAPDRMRELAVEAGFLPEGATLREFYNAIGEQAAGNHVFSAHDAEDVHAWKDDGRAEDLRDQAEAPDDSDTRTPEQRQRDWLRDDLEALGETVDPNATEAELRAQLDERLAMADAASVSDVLDRYDDGPESRAEARGADTQDVAQESEQPRADGTGEGEGEARGGDGGEGEPAAPRDNRRTVDKTAEGDQPAFVGHSAIEAEKARDARHHGRSGSDKPQKGADKDGLFGEPDAADDSPSFMDFLKGEGGGVRLDAALLGTTSLATGAKKVIAALMNHVDDWRQYADSLGELAKALGKGKFFESMQTPDGQWALPRLLRLIYQSENGYMRGVASRFKSDTLTKVIDMLSVPGGDLKGNTKTYDEEVHNRNNLRQRAVQDALAPIIGDKKLKAAEKRSMLEQVVKQVRNPRSINPGTRIGKVAQAVQKILKEELEHMRKAGVDIGEVKSGYFPREMDKMAIMSDREGFLAAAAKLYADDFSMDRKEAAAAAADWMDNILYGGAGRPGGNGGGFGAPNFTKGRVFSDLMEKRLEKYLLKDPDATLASYVHRSTKRAAIASRFGDNFSKWDELTDQIRKEGAGAAIGELRKHVEISTGGTAAWGNNELIQRASSVVRTWTSLWALNKAVLASLSEPFYAAARTGNVFDGLTAAASTAKEFFRTKGMGKTELREFAEDIGAIAGAHNHATMAARWSGDDVIGQAQQTIMAHFFHRTKLEALTNASIVAQAGTAQVFMRRLASDITKGGATAKSSRLYMKELGIPDGKVDEFAKAVVALKGELPTRANMKGEMGDLARDATNRFQRQVIQQPNASSRPRWAGHPLGSVAFQLSSWTYSFTRNILVRGARLAKEAVTNKDLAAADRARLLMGTLPGLALAGVVQYGVGEMRDWIDDTASAAASPDGKSQRRELTGEAKVERAISRTGLTGNFDPLIQLMSGLRYGRATSSAIAGPGISRVMGAADIVANMFTRNSDKTNTAERKLAGTFYDLAVAPMVNIALTAAPVGIFGTAASVLGIGAGKEPFTQSAAGPLSRDQLRKVRKEPVEGILQHLLGD